MKGTHSGGWVLSEGYLELGADRGTSKRGRQTLGMLCLNGAKAVSPPCSIMHAKHTPECLFISLTWFSGTCSGFRRYHK